MQTIHETEFFKQADAITNEALYAGGQSYSEENPGPNGETFSLRAGDAEIVDHIRTALEAKPESIPLIEQPASNADKRKAAQAIAKSITSPVVNADTGKAVKVSIGGAHHFAAHSGDPLKWSMLPKIETILKRAIFIRSEKPDARKAKDKNLRAFHKFALPVTIDSTPRLAKITIQEDGNGNWFYDAAALEIEWPADVSTGPDSIAGERTPDIQQAAERIAHESFGVKTGSDESQETNSLRQFDNARAVPTDKKARVFEFGNGRMVGPTTFSIRAFHGTPHEVDRFSLAHIGTGEGAQAAQKSGKSDEFRAMGGETYSLRPDDYESRIAAAFSPFQRSPELRMAIAQVAKQRATRLGAEWIEKGVEVRKEARP